MPLTFAAAKPQQRGALLAHEAGDVVPEPHRVSQGTYTWVPALLESQF